MNKQHKIMYTLAGVGAIASISPLLVSCGHDNNTKKEQPTRLKEVADTVPENRTIELNKSKNDQVFCKFEIDESLVQGDEKVTEWPFIFIENKYMFSKEKCIDCPDGTDPEVTRQKAKFDKDEFDSQNLSQDLNFYIFTNAFDAFCDAIFSEKDTVEVNVVIIDRWGVSYSTFDNGKPFFFHHTNS